MRTTIDAAGRLVVPKPLCDELGLIGGQEVDIEVQDGRLEVSVLPTPMRLQRKGQAVFGVPADELPPLSPEEVRATLERVRR